MRPKFAVTCLTMLALVGPPFFIQPRFARAAETAPNDRAPVRRLPNIVWIMADDLGYGDLGVYGQQLIATPRIDRLAAEATRFTQVYAGASVCAPSRCTLMTGLHGGHAFIRENQPVVGGAIEIDSEGQRRLSLRKEDRTVAELLQAAGYRTGITGKWGLAEPGTDGEPTKKGFDEWLGHLNQNRAKNHYSDYLWRGTQKFTIPGNQNGGRKACTQDLFTDFALDFITRNQERPFFLYLPYGTPHRDWDVADQGEYADRDWPEAAKNFAAMVRDFDRDVGRVLDRLQELGLDEDTIVFVTSDNGAVPKDADWQELFQSGGSLRGNKGSLYEGGIRVPMIVRWPGVVPRGAVSDAPWYFPDFLATAAELAGVSPIEPTDGVSVLPQLRNPHEQSSPRFLYWESPLRGKKFQQAARLGKWKAVRQGWGRPLELYDLDTDAGETRNVANEQPDVVDAFEAYFSTARRESLHWPVAKTRGPVLSSGPWARHTIDDRLDGSDGTRLADVDGDGRLDVVSSWENTGLTRLYLQPELSKVRGRWPFSTIGVTPSAEEALFIDLDADGTPDVVSSQEKDSERVTVLWGPKDRRRALDPVAWRQDSFPAVEGVARWMYATASQIDGRHGVDLVLGGKTETEEVSGRERKRGVVGWLEAPADPRDTAGWKWHPLKEVNGTMSVEVTDLNGDGHLDILQSDAGFDGNTNASMGVWWFENPGPGTVAGPWKIRGLIPAECTVSGVKFLTFADLDGDGLQDILVNADRDRADRTREVEQFVLWLRRLDDRGTKWSPQEIALPSGSPLNKGIAVGDLDNDGRNEIVVTSAKIPLGQSGVYYLQYEKSPFDGTWQAHDISGPEGSKYDVAHLVDFNGDGFLDVLTNDESEYDNIRELGVVWYENPGAAAPASTSRAR